MGFEVKNMTKKQKMETIKKEEMIKNGDKIKVEYTGTFSDGKVFDSSKGREPLCFEVGAKQVIPGFEQAVIGMKKDENKTFLIKSEEAYRAALSIGPKLPPVLYSLLDLYRAKGEGEKLKEIGNVILKYWPDNPEIKDILSK